MGTMGTEFGSRTWWQSALRLAAAFALVMAGLSICACIFAGAGLVG